MGDKLTIKQHRMLRDLTQNEMAERLGIHYSTYRNWETEPSKISIKYAKDIAIIFGVSIDDIFFNN